MKTFLRQALAMLLPTVISVTSPEAGIAQEERSEPLPPLGILFYTPSTREALDEARRSGRQVEKRSGDRKAVETSLRVNGMVIAKDGRKTAWVNGRTVRSGEEISDGLRVTVKESDSGLVRLNTPDKGLVKVKPGESIRSLLNEPLQPPAVMNATAAAGAQAGASRNPDSLEARLERVPADVSLRDLISVLLAAPETDQGTPAQSSKDDRDQTAERR